MAEEGEVTMTQNANDRRPTCSSMRPEPDPQDTSIRTAQPAGQRPATFPDVRVYVPDAP